MRRVKGEAALIIVTLLFCFFPATASSAKSSDLEIHGIVKILTGEPLADIEVRGLVSPNGILFHNRAELC